MKFKTETTKNIFSIEERLDEMAGKYRARKDSDGTPVAKVSFKSNMDELTIDAAEATTA
jgi:hypothetical protein